MMRMHWLVLSAAVCFAGCAIAEDVEATRLGVRGGTPSTLDSIGIVVNSSSGCTVAGAFLSPRHLIVAGCVDGSELAVASPDGNRIPITYTAVVATHAGPATGLMAGPREVAVHILVTAAEMPVTSPASVATTAPTVDDMLTLTGFGGESRAADLREPTEGPVRVTRGGTGDFSFVGVGEVRSCYNDAPVFDASGDLTGLVALGSLDPIVEDCFGDSTAVAMSPMATWVAEVLAMPVPDPVPLPGSDAGVSDGGSSDAGPGADASTGEMTDGGGCQCTASGGSGSEAGWLFAVAGLLAWRLRRRGRVANRKNRGR